MVLIGFLGIVKKYRFKTCKQTRAIDFENSDIRQTVGNNKNSVESN